MIAPVVTVTPNPSIDRTVEIPALAPGSVLRASGSRVDPGGKGVNVSRVLAAFARPSVAIMPGGTDDLAALLRAVGVTPVTTPAVGPTRVNTALVEPDGTTTKVNEPGVQLRADEVAALVDAVAACAASPEDVASHALGASDVPSLAPDASDATSSQRWVVTAGSIPRGAPADLHARIVRAAHGAGARVAVDTSGEPLAAALAAVPDLIKPNVAELAELVGHPLPRLADVLDAAAEIRSAGVATVLVSMGAAGALLVSEDGARHAASTGVTAVRSTVGAGDSMLAGYLIAATSGADAPGALVHAVACGAAAVGLPGTAVPGPADVDTTTVATPSRPDTTLDLTGEAA